MFSLRATLIAAATTALGLGSAFAAAPNPATATFKVKVVIAKACTVVAGTASDIDFGTVDANSTTALIRSNTINVTCSKKTPYTIGLQSGFNASTAGAGEMRLIGAATPTADQKIAYQLQQTSGGAAWGSAAANRYSTGTTGTGAAQPFTVYANVLGTAWNVEPGSYEDTVTVDVAY